MPNAAETLKKDTPRELTALVAGGASFIGSHLCEALLAQNVRVICVDNFSQSRRENLALLISNPRFTLIEHDLNEQSFSLPEQTPVDYVFHLAGVEEKLGQTDLSLETLLVNSLGTKNLLDLAREKKAKFLLLSSADIYSGGLSSSSLNYYFGRSRKEEKLLSHHEAKRYAEALTFEYYKKYNIDARICRILDGYGPRMNFQDGSDLSKLLHEAMTTNKLTIKGDGLKTLHPTFVADIVYGMIKSVLMADTRGKIFQLISPEKITYLAFAEQLKKALGKSFDLVYEKEDLEVNFPYHTLELHNTVETLNWHPKVSLVDGLIRTQASLHKPASGSLPPLTPIQLTPKPPQEIRLPKISLPRWKWPQWGHRDGGPKSHLKKVRRGRSGLRMAIFLASLLLLILGVFYPMLSFIFNVYVGTNNFQSSLTKLGGMDLDQAQELALRGENAWQGARTDLDNLSWLLTILHWRGQADSWDQTLSALTKLASATRLTALGIEGLPLLQANFAGKGEATALKITSQLARDQINLALAADRLALAEAELKNLDPAEPPQFFGSKVELLKDQVSVQKQTLTSLRALYPLLLENLGFTGPKTFLINQLNTKVPKFSGGISERYLLVTLINGQITAVGEGEVSALVGSAVRPNNRSTAALAPSLADEVDLPTVAADLKARLLARAQVVDSVVFTTAAFWQSLNSTLGSSDFETLRTSLPNFQTPQWRQLVAVLSEQLFVKNLAMVSFDPVTQGVLNRYGWDGAVLDEEELLEAKVLAAYPNSTPNALVTDYWQLGWGSSGSQETELAAKVDYQLTISPVGVMEVMAILDFTNNSQVAFSGKGRVLVPMGSSVENSPSQPLLEVSQKFEKTQITFPLVVAASGSSQLRLQYVIPFQVTKTGGVKTYSIIIQKGLGAPQYPFKAALFLPDYLKFGPLSPLTLDEDTPVLQALVGEDQLLALLLTPKAVEN